MTDAHKKTCLHLVVVIIPTAELEKTMIRVVR